MAWRDTKWKHLLIAFIITLVVLFSLYYIWQRLAVERPLTQILEQDVSVRIVELTSEGRNVSLIVHLEHVDDLGSTVRRLREIAYGVQSNIASMEFLGSSTKELEEAYQDIHFALYQARVTGQYVDMAESVSNYVKISGLSAAKVEVDDKAIYLQLHAGEGYLYKILELEREQKRGGGTK